METAQDTPNGMTAALLCLGTHLGASGPCAGQAVVHPLRRVRWAAVTNEPEPGTVISRGQGGEATPGIEPGYTALQAVASDHMIAAQSTCLDRR